MALSEGQADALQEFLQIMASHREDVDPEVAVELLSANDWSVNKTLVFMGVSDRLQDADDQHGFAHCGGVREDVH